MILFFNGKREEREREKRDFFIFFFFFFFYSFFERESEWERRRRRRDWSACFEFEKSNNAKNSVAIETKKVHEAYENPFITPCDHDLLPLFLSFFASSLCIRYVRVSFPHLRSANTWSPCSCSFPPDCNNAHRWNFFECRDSWLDTILHAWKRCFTFSSCGSYVTSEDYNNIFDYLSYLTLALPHPRPISLTYANCNIFNLICHIWLLNMRIEFIYLLLSYTHTFYVDRFH